MKEATAGFPGVASLGEQPQLSSVAEAVYGYFTPSCDRIPDRKSKEERGRKDQVYFLPFEDMLGTAASHVTSQSGSRRDEYWWAGFLSPLSVQTAAQGQSCPQSEWSLPQFTQLVWRLMGMFQGMTPGGSRTCQVDT